MSKAILVKADTENLESTSTTNIASTNELELNIEEPKDIHYSMVKKELLIENEIIMEEKYIKARELMEKIKSDKIDEITREEEENFKLYLIEQRQEISDKYNGSVSNYFILNFYIMFYSKYHLICNKSIYKWSDCGSIGIISQDKFDKIIIYYTKTNVETFHTYMSAMKFTKRGGKSINFDSVKYNEFFNSKNLDLIKIQENLFTNKLKKNKSTLNIPSNSSSSNIKLAKRKCPDSNESNNSNSNSNQQLTNDTEQMEAIFGLINFKKYKISGYESTVEEINQITSTLSSKVSRLNNLSEDKETLLTNNIKKFIDDFVKSNK